MVGDLEQMCQREKDAHVKEKCLQIIAAWGPANGLDIYRYLDAGGSIDLLKYNLTILHRWGSAELKENAEREIVRLLKSEDDDDVLADIWLVGELKLTSFKNEIQLHFGDPSNALYRILEGKAELLDENQKRVDLLEAPFGIGFGFIIRKSVRRYALKCIEDCRMIKISSDDFNEILELNPRIYKNIFEILLTMVDKDIFRL